jgi:hypothetical protein
VSDDESISLKNLLRLTERFGEDKCELSEDGVIMWEVFHPHPDINSSEEEPVDISDVE